MILLNTKNILRSLYLIFSRKMKISIALAFLFVFTFWGCNREDNPISQPTEEEADNVMPIGEEVSGKLLAALKKELVQGIKNEGIVGATRLCNIRAMPLTHMLEVASEYPIHLRRTSFKYRNPKNAPDEFEELALRYFEKEVKGKKPLPKDYIQKIKTEDKVYYYYYKPLKVGALCLNCHGDPASMDPSLVNLLKEKYPEDKALNYSEGDLRGLVSIKIEYTE